VTVTGYPSAKFFADELEKSEPGERMIAPVHCFA
jgi:hypothetical protein